MVPIHHGLLEKQVSDFLMGCGEVKRNPEFLRHILVRVFGEDIPGVGTKDSV